MTKQEFDWAMRQAPPAHIAEAFSQEQALIRVDRPLDRRWLFKGFIKGQRLDWIVPCDCRMMPSKWAPSGEIDASPGGTRACCRGARLSVDGHMEMFFVGECELCHVVYWLQEMI